MSRKYLDAAKVLEKVLAKKGSVKNLTLQNNANRAEKDKKFLFALVSESLKSKDLIDEAIRNSNTGKTIYSEIKNRALVYILLYELLFGTGKINGGGKVKRVLKGVEEKLRQSLLKSKPDCLNNFNGGGKEKPDIHDRQGSIDENRIPKYVRVNTLKASIPEVGQALKEIYESQGYSISPLSSKSSSSDDVSIKAKLSKKRKASELISVDQDCVINKKETGETDIVNKNLLPQVKKDGTMELRPHPILEYVFLLPEKIDLYQESFIKDGRAIIQDLSSCLPAHILINEWPEEDWNHNTKSAVEENLVMQPKKKLRLATSKISEKQGLDTSKKDTASYTFLDACAAPGNKTSQLAMLIAQREKNINTNANFQNKIIAMDRDKHRLRTLEKRVIDQFSCTNVTPILGDFLAVDFENDVRFQNIRGILLDPSCSGSGIVNSLERNLEKQDKHNKQRLTSLSQFQYNALLKALSCPTVERVVYSTCSIHMEENEKVVAAVLRHFEEVEAGENDFTYKLKSCLPSWTRRGIPFGEKNEGGELYLTKEEAACLVRADPNYDHTNGFFVSLFLKEKKNC